MTTLNFIGITGMGCVVYTSVKVSEDYTMNEVVRAIKAKRFTAFKLNTMKRFVNI